MQTTQLIIAIGLCLTLFGAGALIHPNLTRWINAPGSPTIKSLLSHTVGIVLILLSSLDLI
jgi:multisubunit Na+/H+ antiporter MnhG subunit